jgi:hypothetical protein
MAFGGGMEGYSSSSVWGKAARTGHTIHYVWLNVKGVL